MLGPVERLIYRAVGTNPEREQTWKGYARTTVVFSALFWLALYVILRSQGIHFFNPTGFQLGAVGRHLQHDVLVHHQHQLAVLQRRDDHVVPVADGRPGRAELRLGRGRHGGAGGDDPRLRAAQRGHARQLLGGRDAVAALHPAAAVVGRRAACSSPRAWCRRWRARVSFTTAIGGDQTLALGPAASQIAIKQLGTNGGGFFNTNSAMPFENPTQLANFIEVLFILLIPAGLTATFGRMVGSRRQGWTLYSAMLAMFIAGVVVGVPGRAARLARAPRRGHRDERQRRQHRRQPAGCRAALRHRQLGAVGNGDDRRLQRIGQLRPRGLHRHRRPGAARQHGDRGGDLRRGRVGPVRDAAVRPADGVHRRPDGGPHARVPRQEGRGARR